MQNINITVGKNEEKIAPFVWIGGKFLYPEAQTEEDEVTVNVNLSGEGAVLNLVGIFLGTGSSSVVFNTNVIHKAPHTKSCTNIRGVFLDTSSFNNDGMVHIAKGAKGADGYFASKVLLFDDSKGRSVPSLEIDENDLKAGHASTVGRPDENQLFYLRSRGLSEKEAERLIISGFFQPILQYLTEKEKLFIQNRIHSHVKN